MNNRRTASVCTDNSPWFLVTLVIIALWLLLNPESARLQENNEQPVLLTADRIFDGYEFRPGMAILVQNGEVSAIDTLDRLRGDSQLELDLGDATLLPGFIELHAHLLFGKVPPDVVLRHGITTLRDLGGPLHKPVGGQGSLRILTAGPILTVAHGYPITVFGNTDIAQVVESVDDARNAVSELIENGANIIKIALEPGGPHSAPWTMHTHSPHSGHTTDHDRDHPATFADWPILSEAVVRAIVEEAHKQGIKVTAHLSGETGARIALNAGVDEWAHVPCMPLPNSLLQAAARQNVRIVSTMDTFSACSGIHENARNLVGLGVILLYGAEIGHHDVPWGIDAEELRLMQEAGGMLLPDVLRAATSLAGEQAGIPLLGTLMPGAPADIIAVRGDVHTGFKPLEYPDFVMSGGVIVVNNFNHIDGVRNK